MTSPALTSTKRYLIASLTTACLCAVPAVASATAGTSERAVMPGHAATSGWQLDAPHLGEAQAASVAPLVPPLRLAEVNVVNSNPPPPAAPVAAPAPVVSPAPAAVPVQHEVVQHQGGSYMGTIALNALCGAVAGGLVGGALYFLNDDQHHAERVAYWAAGGVLVGAGVGVVQVMMDNRTESVALSKLPTDPAPTHRLALLTMHY